MAELPENYIEQLCNTVAKAILDAFDNLKIEDINMYQLGHNKGQESAVEYLVKNGYIKYGFETEYLLEQIRKGENNDNRICI